MISHMRSICTTELRCPASEARLLGSLHSHGREEASALDYPGQSGNQAELLPTKRKLEGETNLCQERRQKVTVAGAQLKPAFSALPWSSVGLGWVVLTVLQIYLGKCLCKCCPGGIRALDECRDRRTRDPRGLKGQAYHSGSLESHKL